MMPDRSKIPTRAEKPFCFARAFRFNILEPSRPLGASLGELGLSDAGETRCPPQPTSIDKAYHRMRYGRLFPQNGTALVRQMCLNMPQLLRELHRICAVRWPRAAP